MVGIILVYYFYQQSYLSCKFKNVVKFSVHISPIFSYPVTFIVVLKSLWIDCSIRVFQSLFELVLPIIGFCLQRYSLLIFWPQKSFKTQ